MSLELRTDIEDYQRYQRFRCISSSHQWTGTTSETTAKIVSGKVHRFCPAHHLCRLDFSRPEPRTAIADKPDKPPLSALMRKKRRLRKLGPLRTPEQQEAWLNRPRTCTRCPFAGLNRDFPLVMARGELTVRSWCHACANKYRAERHRAVKAEKAQHERDAGRLDAMQSLERKRVTA